MDYASPPYYTYILNLCRNVMHLQSFPMITCKMIYNVLNPEYKSEIEDKYPLYRWNIIWKNIHCKLIDKYDRVVSYKFIYNVLPSKKKLYDMKIAGYDNPTCDICNIPESNLHMFYFCSKIKSLYRFIVKLCEKIVA